MTHMFLNFKVLPRVMNLKKEELIEQLTKIFIGGREIDRRITCL